MHRCVEELAFYNNIVTNNIRNVLLRSNESILHIQDAVTKKFKYIIVVLLYHILLNYVL